MVSPFEVRQAAYLRFKEKNPAATFAEFLTRTHFDGVSKGRLGDGAGAIEVALGSNEAFWKSGEAHAGRLFAAFGLRPEHRVIEYGCGSLRLAAHFIRFLEPGNFLGLDVIDGYFELGKQALGPALPAEKRPRLEIISDASLAGARQFGADRIYSNLVCVHIHPDEIGAYFSNLVSLAHRGGARLIFNAEISETPVRYKFNCWAWPLDFYKENMRGLDLVRASIGRERIKEGYPVKPVEFEFRRAG